MWFSVYLLMEDNIKNAVEEYQCPGCTRGHDISCFEKNQYGFGCGAHSAGTFITGIGRIYLGMPKGFNRLGSSDDCSVEIYNTLKEAKDESSNIFGKFTVSVWKYLNENGHTFVRVFCPRINHTSIMILLENCMDQIEAIEITEEDYNNMD